MKHVFTFDPDKCCACSACVVGCISQNDIDLASGNTPFRKTYDNEVELKDGRLWMLVRTKYGIGQAFSSDGGLTWSEGTDSGLGGPSSRFHIRRLRSGRLLLINHVNFTKRNNLTLLLSEDDGKTWSDGLMLDARDMVSYPDATEAADGYIYITHDRERGCNKKSAEEAMSYAREVLVSRVTEADILAGKLVDPGSYLGRIASKLGAYTGDELHLYEKQ